MVEDAWGCLKTLDAASIYRIPRGEDPSYPTRRGSLASHARLATHTIPTASRLLRAFNISPLPATTTPGETSRSQPPNPATSQPPHRQSARTCKLASIAWPPPPQHPCAHASRTFPPRWRPVNAVQQNYNTILFARRRSHTWRGCMAGLLATQHECPRED
jgi:hypothetical protein